MDALPKAKFVVKEGPVGEIFLFAEPMGNAAVPGVRIHLTAGTTLHEAAELARAINVRLGQVEVQAS